VEFYVGNAKQAAYYYRAAFGMKLIAYRGPETGTRDRVSYVLQQGKIRFVPTTPLSPDGPIAEHINRHGDGVHEIALWVDDAESAYLETTRRSARGVQEPTVREDKDGRVRISVIAAYGETLHAFIERKDYHGAFLPGFRGVDGEDPISRPTGLLHIDHMVGNVGWGQMDAWVAFYRDSHGLPALPALRRQGHRHRVFGSHVESDVERQRPCEVSD
jgi:4-hydroxyphenylpyruvate dioxygenase